MQWEIWASAGFGVTITEVMARDPANEFKAFKNTALTPNVGIGSRFFLTDWLTVNFALRDYIIPDKFEPIPDTALRQRAAMQGERRFAAGEQPHALRRASGSTCPTKFTYKTPGKAAAYDRPALDKGHADADDHGASIPKDPRGAAPGSPWP